MGPNNTAKNLRIFYYWFIPIIIAAKIVRWTVMYYKLVLMSIGNGMAMRMYFWNVLIQNVRPISSQ